MSGNQFVYASSQMHQQHQQYGGGFPTYVAGQPAPPFQPAQPLREQDVRLCCSNCRSHVGYANPQPFTSLVRIPPSLTNALKEGIRCPQGFYDQFLQAGKLYRRDSDVVYEKHHAGHVQTLTSNHNVFGHVFTEFIQLNVDMHRGMNPSEPRCSELETDAERDLKNAAEQGRGQEKPKLEMYKVIFLHLK